MFGLLGRFSRLLRIRTDSGAIAQLGERLICIQEVCGSIPHSSTIYRPLIISSVVSVLCDRAFTTGSGNQMFFNKVNQAESKDCSLALGSLWGFVWWERS